MLTLTCHNPHTTSWNHDVEISVWRNVFSIFWTITIVLCFNYCQSFCQFHNPFHEAYLAILFCLGKKVVSSNTTKIMVDSCGQSVIDKAIYLGCGDLAGYPLWRWRSCAYMLKCFTSTREELDEFRTAIDSSLPCSSSGCNYSIKCYPSLRHYIQSIFIPIWLLSLYV